MSCSTKIMQNASSTIHLIPEPRGAVTGRRETRAASAVAEQNPASLPIPHTVSFLNEGPTGEPQITAAESAGASEALVLEPVALHGGQTHLLLLNAGAAHVRVNGSPSPRVALLRERDQFQFGDSCVFHVAIFHRPQIGPPPADKMGKPCPVC
jgi:hypothetical protein